MKVFFICDITMYDIGQIMEEEERREQDKALSEKIAAAYQLGRKDMKEQMMKEAVEWTVTTNLANRPVIYFDKLRGYKYGDKVRIIILPKED